MHMDLITYKILVSQDVNNVYFVVVVVLVTKFITIEHDN
jgi:hypothetical protein